MPNGENPNGDPNPIPPMLNAELQIPEAVIEKYDSAQQKADRLEKVRLGVEVLTLVAIVAYACISYQQWIATQQSADAATSAAKTARDALHISERAYLTLAGPTTDMGKKASKLVLTNSGRMAARNVELITHEATFASPGVGTTIIGIGRAPIEKHWKRTRLPSVANGNPYTFLIPSAAMDESSLRNSTQMIVIAGYLGYSSGFPDDAEERVPFCHHTIYHFLTKDLHWTPCPDSEQAIKILEGIDGYPQNEQQY